jgi:hypothetical protein
VAGRASRQQQHTNTARVPIGLLRPSKHQPRPSSLPRQAHKQGPPGLLLRRQAQARVMAQMTQMKTKTAVMRALQVLSSTAG